MASPTRIEMKQRPHKRHQGIAEVSSIDGPVFTPDEVTWVKGRRPRYAQRTAPFWAGFGLEVFVLVVA